MRLRPEVVRPREVTRSKRSASRTHYVDRDRVLSPLTYQHVSSLITLSDEWEVWIDDQLTGPGMALPDVVRWEQLARGLNDGKLGPPPRRPVHLAAAVR